MAETAHIQPIKPAEEYFSTLILLKYTIIAPSQWHVLYFNDKGFFFLFRLPVTATGFSLSKIFSLSTCGIAPGCCCSFGTPYARQMLIA